MCVVCNACWKWKERRKYAHVSMFPCSYTNSRGGKEFGTSYWEREMAMREEMWPTHVFYLHILCLKVEMKHIHVNV